MPKARSKGRDPSESDRSQRLDIDALRAADLLLDHENRGVFPPNDSVALYWQRFTDKAKMQEVSEETGERPADYPAEIDQSGRVIGRLLASYSLSVDWSYEASYPNGVPFIDCIPFVQTLPYDVQLILARRADPFVSVKDIHIRAIPLIGMTNGSANELLRRPEIDVMYLQSYAGLTTMQSKRQLAEHLLWLWSKNLDVKRTHGWPR